MCRKLELEVFSQTQTERERERAPIATQPKLYSPGTLVYFYRAQRKKFPTTYNKNFSELEPEDGIAKEEGKEHSPFYLKLESRSITDPAKACHLFPASPRKLLKAAHTQRRRGFFFSDRQRF